VTKSIVRCSRERTLAKLGSETNRLRLWLWSMKAPLLRVEMQRVGMAVSGIEMMLWHVTCQAAATVRHLSAAISITERCLISHAVLYLEKQGQFA
jgi:hypothetical protein